MRSGILAAGNFIIDNVKIIDAYPEQDMLANIEREVSGNGGGPYNVLRDLSAMGAAFPLEAAGLIGADNNGAWIVRDCLGAGIDVSQLQKTNEAPTSYTDAMTVASTGRRTFFHQRGANALFNETHINFSSTRAKLFHLGYLMLLDSMDSFVGGGRTRASLALEKAKQAGLRTSVDIVSTENNSFREIAESALPFTDYLIINEIEAGKIVGMELKNATAVDVDACVEAARALLGRGVNKQVVIHFVEGGVVADARGHVTRHGSLKLPEGFVAGATGAGDAFAAGYLLGIHGDLEPHHCLQFGVCAAAQCLSHPTTSQGLKSVEQCLALGRKLGFREL